MNDPLIDPSAEPDAYTIMMVAVAAQGLTATATARIGDDDGNVYFVGPQCFLDRYWDRIPRPFRESCYADCYWPERNPLLGLKLNAVGGPPPQTAKIPTAGVE